MVRTEATTVTYFTIQIFQFRSLSERVPRPTPPSQHIEIPRNPNIQHYSTRITNIPPVCGLNSSWPVFHSMSYYPSERSVLDPYSICLRCHLSLTCPQHTFIPGVSIAWSIIDTFRKEKYKKGSLHNQFARTLPSNYSSFRTCSNFGPSNKPLVRPYINREGNISPSVSSTAPAAGSIMNASGPSDPLSRVDGVHALYLQCPIHRKSARPFSMHTALSIDDYLGLPLCLCDNYETNSDLANIGLRQLSKERPSTLLAHFRHMPKELQLEVLSYVNPTSLFITIHIYPDIAELFTFFGESLKASIIEHQFARESQIFTLQKCDWTTNPTRYLWLPQCTPFHLLHLSYMQDATHLIANFFTEHFSTCLSIFEDFSSEILDLWLFFCTSPNCRDSVKEIWNYIGSLDVTRRHSLTRMIILLSRAIRRFYPIIWPWNFPVRYSQEFSYPVILPILDHIYIYLTLNCLRESMYNVLKLFYEHRPKSIAIVEKIFGFEKLWDRAVYTCASSQDHNLLILSRKTYIIRYIGDRTNGHMLLYPPSRSVSSEAAIADITADATTNVHYFVGDLVGHNEWMALQMATRLLPNTPLDWAHFCNRMPRLRPSFSHPRNLGWQWWRWHKSQFTEQGSIGISMMFEMEEL